MKPAILRSADQPAGALRSWDDLPRHPDPVTTGTWAWSRLERELAQQVEWGLDPNPVWQRGNVWTDAQRVAYVEHVLRGGQSGRELLFVCTNWEATPAEGYALADGKQRLEAVRAFMRGELRAFADAARPEGYAVGDFAGRVPSRFEFLWRVVPCRSLVDVLDLYLRFNAGGTTHAQAELDRVQAMRDGLARGG